MARRAMQGPNAPVQADNPNPKRPGDSDDPKTGYGGTVPPQPQPKPKGA